MSYRKKIVSFGTSGDDAIYANGSRFVFGFAGNDYIVGTSRSEYFFGGNGNDTLRGFGGRDVLRGGHGNDKLEGGAGTDFLFGGRGSDTAYYDGSILGYSWYTRRSFTKVYDKDASDGNTGRDYLYSVERLQFSDYIYILNRNNAAYVSADDVTTDENSAVLFTVNAVDFEGDALSLLSASAASGAVVTLQDSVAARALKGKGAVFTLEYAPGDLFDALNDGDAAQDSITLEIQDAKGAVTTKEVNVTVTGVSDTAALVARDDYVTVSEDDISIEINPFLNDTASEDYRLTLEVFPPVEDPAAGDAMSVVNNFRLQYDTNGAFDYLAPGETVVREFRYRVNGENILNGDRVSVSANVFVTVEGQNHAPVANNDGDLIFYYGSSTVLDLLANDTDPDGDTLSVMAVDTSSLLGTLTENTDGAYTYSVDREFVSLYGTREPTVPNYDIFTYTLSDGNGGTAQGEVRIDFYTTGGVIIMDDAVTLSEDEIVSFDLYANDPRPAVPSIVDRVFFDNAGGNVTFSDGVLTVDPAGDYDYLPEGDTATITGYYGYNTLSGPRFADVTVTITGVNDAPVAVDDILYITAEPLIPGAAAVTPMTPADNDTDAEGDALTIDFTKTDATALKGKLLTGLANEFLYDQQGAFAGLRPGESEETYFDYTVIDGNGGEDTARMTIRVNSGNTGFESGLFQWNRTAGANTTAGEGDVTPTHGQAAAKITAAASAADVEALTGAAPGTFAGAGGAISKEFALNAGDVLAFDFRFIAGAAPEAADDSAFVTDINSGGLATLAAAAGGDTLWQRYEATVAADGVFDFAIGITDAGTDAGGAAGDGSILYIDNLTIDYA